jgi:hypothetical protein
VDGCAKLALVFPFAFAALNFAHRSFDAFEIFALGAADITRFFPPVVLPPLLPIALSLRADKFSF